MYAMDEWVKYLKDSWGLDSSFAQRVALLVAWLNYYGLAPQIRSGFRDPEHQKQLRAAWDAGNRAGLRARPAVDSLHTKTSWGRPSAKAIDIVTRNEELAARIARYLGIGAGLDFSTPDPGHYFEVNA